MNQVNKYVIIRGKMRKEVDARLYDKKYFFTDNEGYKEYKNGLDNYIHPKFKKSLEFAGKIKNKVILDIGCGRGELIYYCVKGGGKVFGVDYSKDAIDIARQTIEKLPLDLQRFAKTEVGDVVKYSFDEKFDIVFMIDVAEHMYNWQLKEIFKKIRNILNNGGKLILITPNYYYVKYLDTLKRAVNIPLNLIKWPLRILRGKYKPKSFFELLQKIFRIRANRGNLDRMMHVNILTCSKLKRHLKDFSVNIYCEDPSKNIFSLLLKHWCGRNIIAIATKK